MHQLVVARYKESVSWINSLSDEFDVTIYNKSESIRDLEFVGRPAKVVQRPNFGREAESYLYHIVSNYHDLRGTLVFSQADPFEHSPNFLELLRTIGSWPEIQPLSHIWKLSEGIPPRELLEGSCSDTSRPSKLRKERYSLATLAPVEFHDPGAIRVAEFYKTQHVLSNAENIAAHFLRRCGLNGLSEMARAAQIGSFYYGAMFGVSAELVKSISIGSWERMHAIAVSEEITPWILERLWFHLFGEPFLRICT